MDLLREDLVAVPLASRTRADALSELVQRLIDAGELSAASRGPVLAAIEQRETLNTTGLGSGVAVPHGLTDCVSDVVAALGIAPHGIDFAAIDGSPVTIVVLLVVPPNRIQLHVRALAGVARLLNDHVLRERLVRAGSAAEAMDVIVAKEEASVR
jgi:PTS system fructose-specific IIA component